MKRNLILLLFLACATLGYAADPQEQESATVVAGGDASDAHALLPPEFPTADEKDDQLEHSSSTSFAPRKSEKTRARRDIMIMMQQSGDDDGRGTYIPPMFCKKPIRGCNNNCPGSVCDCILTPHVRCYTYANPIY